MKSRTRSAAVAAIAGAAYAVFTVIPAPISYGVIQFRISEALCVLPFFIPSTAFGLFIGCALANLVTGNIFDIVFGSLATLASCLAIAAIGIKSRGLKARILACFMPVLFNGLIIGAVITKAYSGLSLSGHPEVFWANAGWVSLGETCVMYLLGLPAMKYLSSSPFLLRLMNGESSHKE